MENIKVVIDKGEIITNKETLLWLRDISFWAYKYWCNDENEMPLRDSCLMIYLELNKALIKLGEKGGAEIEFDSKSKNN